MLIASRIKRPNAPIELGDKVYFFKPLDPNNPDLAHVCEVTDNAHIGRLLGITECYYIPEDHELGVAPPKAAKPKPNTETPPPPPPAGPSATTTPPPPAGTVVVSELPAEQAEAAKNLSELSWQKLKSVLSQGGVDGAVIHEALRIELAKPEEDQRSTVVKVLKTAIEGN